MKNHWILIILLSVFCLSQSNGQEEEKPVFAFKYVPSGLVDYYATYVQFAGEYFIGDGVSTELEVGFPVASSLVIEEPTMRVRGGFKVRTGWRQYAWTQRFVGMSLMYKSEGFFIEGDFQRQAGTFNQRLWYGLEQQTYAAYGTFGFTPNITNHLMVEIMGGAGIRYINRTFNSVPVDAEFISNGAFFGQYEEKPVFLWLPSMFLSMKIGVLF